MHRLFFLFFFLPFSLSAQLTNSTLPIVHITTSSNAIPADVKIIGDMGVIRNNSGTNNINDAFNHFSGKVGIERRGNSTLDIEKPSYAIELRRNGNTNLDRQFALLDMPAEEDWILHSSHFDKTFLRIPFSFDLWEKMGYYAPRLEYVELVLNGDYKGVYILCEKNKQGPDRMGIATMTTNDNNDPEITGGYIIRMDWKKRDGWFSNYRSLGGGQLFIQYNYPRPEDISLAQKEYIKNYVDSFETALFTKNYIHPTSGKNVSEYLDINSMADQFILFELSKSVDAYKLSTFMHKERGGKMAAGPVWDFDLAYHNAAYCGCDNSTGWTYLQDAFGCDDLDLMPMWWLALTCNPDFQDAVWRRWQNYRSTFLSADSLDAYLDQWKSVLSTPQSRNFQRWPVMSENLFSEPEPIPASYDLQVERFREFLHARASWMDANVASLACQNYTSPVFISNDFLIFPNPSSGQISISMPNRVSKVQIYDAASRLVYEDSNPNFLYSLDISTWAKGMYEVFALTLSDEGEEGDKPRYKASYAGKFIKQ